MTTEQLFAAVQLKARIDDKFSKLSLTCFTDIPNKYRCVFGDRAICRDISVSVIIIFFVNDQLVGSVIWRASGYRARHSSPDVHLAVTFCRAFYRDHRGQEYDSIFLDYNLINELYFVNHIETEHDLHR